MQITTKRLGISMVAVVAVMLLATGGAAAADDTTVIEGVNNSTVENASNFNVTYDTSEINSSATLVESHDPTNETAVLAVEIGSTTVNKSVDYTNHSQYTVDYTTETEYPTSVSGDVNVTVGQSAIEVVANGSTLYDPSPLGGSSGSDIDSTLLFVVLGGAAVVVLLRDD